ncbi:MAG: post-PEP-CTERM-1 domain-containing protein [Pyrinomonadaceae bacterium]
MKEKSSKHSTARRRRRLLLFAAVAVVVAVTAITVISRQKGRITQAANREAAKAAATTTRTFVTRRVGNQDIHIDTQSGEIKPLTAEEAQKLANGLAPMLDDSADGLVQVRHADGSVSMDLQGRFQNVTVARVNSDGTIDQSCVDNPRAAAKFFRIDPKLIENAPTARKRVKSN